MQAVLDLPADPSSVTVARQFIRLVVRAWRIGWNEHNAELLTSELVTRAVGTSVGPVSVEVWQRGPYLRVEVHDSHPVPRQPAGEPDGGLAADRFGLVLITELADRWGYEPIVTGDVTGTCLWFELALSPAEWPVSDPGPLPSRHAPTSGPTGG